MSHLRATSAQTPSTAVNEKTETSIVIRKLSGLCLRNVREAQIYRKTNGMNDEVKASHCSATAARQPLQRQDPTHRSRHHCRTQLFGQGPTRRSSLAHDSER